MNYNLLIFENMISELDVFGYPIKFHFKQKGYFYSTNHTGFFSFCFKIFMLWIFYKEFKSMMEYSKDWIYTTDSAISSFDLGEVNLKRMDGLPFYTFEEDGNKVL